MLKKLITKNHNSRKLIFFNQNKRLNIKNEEINIKTSIQLENVNNKTSKTKIKEL